MKSQRLKKVTCCAILVFTLLLSCFLAGCQDKTPENANQTDGSKANPTPPTGNVSEGPEPVELPISEEGITLTMFCILDGKAGLTLRSLEDNLAMQEYEKLTGIDIEWSHPSSASTTAEALNVMIASNDMTDIISNVTDASDNLDELINKGVILRLNELIEQYGYNLSKAFEEYPEFYNQVLTYEGNIGLYPSSRLDEQARYFESFIIREDWLKQLNLGMPTTVDDWYNTLKAFKTQDPNGNGKDDELPFVSNSLEEMGVSRLSSLWGFNACFFKWYDEGLIDSEYISTDATGWKEKVLTDKGGCFYGKMNGGIGTLLGSFDYSNDEDFSLVPVPYATTEDGKSYDLYSQDIFDMGGCAISTSCKYPKEAVKWLDYLYSPEGQVLASFGVEGVTYEYDSDGVPHYTELITNNPDGLSMVNAIAKYSIGGIAPRLVNDKYYWEAVMSYDQQKLVYPTISTSTTERKVPGNLKYSDKEFDRLNKLMADIGTYYKECLHAFIMGSKPLDEMDEFKEQLNKMGLEEAVSIMQEAYNRYEN